MSIVATANLSDFLLAIAELLDLPGHLYEDAVLKYTDVGEWLGCESSELAKFSPDIFPQGSFRLGTMIKPLTDRDEYDIDLVCHLKIDKRNTTQKELKERVGKRLAARDDIQRILEPCRRCWRLDYSNLFHMDVLPAIPNPELPPSGIHLTDTELRLWQHSNPIGYAEWFKDRMKVLLSEKRAAYAREHQMSVEDVPDWRVKTPLQRVVQLLKRHRDVYFQKDAENRPVSIIITTLAAKAYRNQADLFEALSDVVRDMPTFIEYRDDGKWWVANPVDPNENFADKWNEKPDKLVAFFNWLQKVREDFAAASKYDGFEKAAGILSPAFKAETVAKALSAVGGQPLRFSLAVRTAEPQVPALADSRHCELPPWPVRPSEKANVTIRGGVYSKRNSGKELWPLNQRKPLPKNVSLKFTATTNVKRPYRIQWQVVNTGNDAQKANQLRGGFEEGTAASGEVRWESTLYAGTHWIEAFVIKDDICVARSNRFYVRVRG